MKTVLVPSGAAFALLWASLAAPAVAVPLPSDSLQVGNSPTEFLIEGTEGGPNPLSQSVVISEPGQNITGFRDILLLEPGTTETSDLVNASITNVPGVGFVLDVALTSDNETPLSFGGIVFESIPETGAVQDLGPAFTDAFDLNTPLPAINVRSDLHDVPEPSTWALMLMGFLGLGFAALRRSRKDDAIAAG